MEEPRIKPLNFQTKPTTRKTTVSIGIADREVKKFRVLQTPIRVQLIRQHRARRVHRIRIQMIRMIQPAHPILRIHHIREPKVTQPTPIHRIHITDTDIASTSRQDLQDRHQRILLKQHRQTIHSTRSVGNIIC